MAELIDVRSAAEVLEDLLAEARNIPNDFPRSPMQDMMQSLKSLPEGTAIESRLIMHAADRRLSRLRRQYFRHQPKDGKNMGDRHISGVERGQALDKAAGQLKSTIGSALDECRFQEVGENSPDDYDPWGYDAYDNEPDAADLPSDKQMGIDLESRALETELQSEQGELARILKPESKNSDRLKRALKDTENLNRMSRAELQFPGGSQSIRQELNTRLRGTIPVMRKAIKGVKKGLDFAQSASDEWETFKANKSGYIISKITNIANNIDDTLRKLEHAPPVDPKIQKTAETKATALLKRNKAVPDNIAVNVRALNLMLSKFSKPNLLANIPWLQNLDLRGTKITDIGVLKGMNTLQNLYLSGTKITDIGVLKELKQLRNVWLDDTPVKDWLPVAHIKNVTGRPDDWEARGS